MKKQKKRSYSATAFCNASQLVAQYRHLLLATALLAGGTLQLMPQVLAQIATGGTAAGTSISNTATATYQDPNNPGTTLNATSNTVTVQVAEVAGVSLTANGIVEAPNTVTNPGTSQGDGVINTGDVVYFSYTITNVGNDPTQFFIPAAPSLVAGATFDRTNLTTGAGPIQITAVNGTAITPVDVGATGGTTGTLLGVNGSIVPGGTVTIRVPVRVTANTSGAPIRVVLGDTGANDNSATTQNQAYIANASNLDLYTQDNNDGAVLNEVAGTPVNGDVTNRRQEASASQLTFLASTTKAFATVLKASAGFTAGTDGTTAPNGTLTYNLGLNVQANSPDISFVASDLQGTALNVTGLATATGNLVLVSDVIPSNTTLVTTGVNAPVAPNGNWTIVYSTDDPAVTGNTALQAAWSTTPTGTIRRIGYVYDATTNGALPRGTSLSGFRFSVATAVSGSGTIANIAQVFGQTTSGTGQPLVYDESGDQQPNNYNSDNTAGPFSNVTPTDFNGGIPGAGQTVSDPNQYRGIATPATQGVDNSNTNTGTGPSGEVNVYAVQPTGSVILNGPNGQPGAVGPTSNNDDFTNQSTPVPANAPADATTPFVLDPAPISFTNTVNNSGLITLTNILLRPLAPATATDLPNGTTVTITLGANTGVYTYDSATGFTLTSGTPISIPSLAAGVSLNYTTVVDLPGNTRLSTDTAVNRGFPVPVVAFTDNNANGQFDQATDTGNITIDRVYTGYLKLTKAARVLDANGTQVAPATGYTSDVAQLNASIRPGFTIEYQIQYKNISEVSNGTGNVVLNAGNVVITEDGGTAPNNWFAATNSPTRDSIFPANPNGSASASAGTVTVTVQNSDIRIYVNNVGTVVPSGSLGAANGTFTFQRRIN